MEEVPNGEAPAGLSGSATLWVAILVVLILIVVAYFAMRDGKKEGYSLHR